MVSDFLFNRAIEDYDNSPELDEDQVAHLRSKKVGPPFETNIRTFPLCAGGSQNTLDWRYKSQRRTFTLLA